MHFLVRERPCVGLGRTHPRLFGFNTPVIAVGLQASSECYTFTLRLKNAYINNSGIFKNEINLLNTQKAELEKKMTIRDSHFFPKSSRYRDVIPKLNAACIA